MSQRIMMGVAMILAAATGKAESISVDSSKVYDIDEVIVVSQPKEAFRLRQQPLSSTSFGNFEMNRLGVRDLRELSSYIPNFVMPNYGSRLSSAVYVRGIGSRVNSPAIGVYVDGIPVMSKSAFNLHTYQLSRVDVLRGPQGTLYGQNTEGGLVRLYSRNAFDYQGTDVRIGYGSRRYSNLEASHYQRLGEDVALMVGGFYNAQTGFFRNTTTGERADDYREAGGKLMLTGRLHSGWKVNVTADYQYVDQSAFPYGSLDLNTGKAEQPASTFPGSYRRNNLITGLTLSYDANTFSLASTTSYQYLKDHMYMDQDYLEADYMRMMQDQLQNAMTQEFSLKSRKPVGRRVALGCGSLLLGTMAEDQRPRVLRLCHDHSHRQCHTAADVWRHVAGYGPAHDASRMTHEQALAPAAQMIERAGGVSMNVEMGAPEPTIHPSTTSASIMRATSTSPHDWYSPSVPATTICSPRYTMRAWHT